MFLAHFAPLTPETIYWNMLAGGWGNMHLILHKRLSDILRRKSIVFLAIWWFAGLILGALAAYHLSYSFFSLMRAAAQSRVSIVSLMTVTLLPLFASALAVFLDRPVWIFGISFVKAFLYSLCIAGTIGAFGSAAWLVAFLFLFSDNLTIPVLFLFCLRHIEGRKRSFWADCLICSGVCVLVGIIDSCLISPFLANL